MSMHIDVLLAGLCMGLIVSSSDRISPPFLRASPNHTFYYKGEAVTLTCATPRECRRTHFIFYKNSEYIRTDNTCSYHIYGMDYSDIGNYACDFRSGSHLSPRSNEVSLFLSDRSPAPAISLNPLLSEYSMGESVTIVCSPPKTWVVKKIQFYKEGHLQPLKETEDNTYVIFTSNKEVAGRYFCTYTLEIQDRLMPSLFSQYIIVNVSVSTEATIIPETSILEKTSKTRGTETSIPTQSSKLTNSAKLTEGTIVLQTPAHDMENKTWTTEKTLTGSLKLLIFAGGLILITTCVLIQALVQLYISRNGKREGTMVEPPVPESDLRSVHNLKTIVQPSLCPSALQEKETHFYSEIELPIVKAPPPIVSFYAKAKAIDPVPPVYQTDLATYARNEEVFVKPW